jgi:protein-disulfide isomerase
MSTDGVRRRLVRILIPALLGALSVLGVQQVLQLSPSRLSELEASHRAMRQDLDALRNRPVTGASGAARQDALPQVPLPLAGAEVKGSESARVALIMYSDFQCPFCGRFANDTLPELEREYVSTGRLRLAFRHLPIEQLHPDAIRAAEAAECGGRQGKFWEMHDLLFQDPRRLGPTDLMAHGASIGLDPAQFEKCMLGETTAEIRQELSVGTSLGISGTPTFFLGPIQEDGRVRVVDRFSGAQPVSVFVERIEAVLGRGEGQ